MGITHLTRHNAVVADMVAISNKELWTIDFRGSRLDFAPTTVICTSPALPTSLFGRYEMTHGNVHMAIGGIIGTFTILDLDIDCKVCSVRRWDPRCGKYVAVPENKWELPEQRQRTVVFK